MAPVTSPETATMSTAATVNVRTPTALASSSRVRETGIVSR